MKLTGILFATCITLLTMGSTFAQWEYTVYDAMGSVMYANDSVPEPCCFYSGYAFQQFNIAELSDSDSEYTVFVPTQEAVEELMALMNLNQWDLVGFSDLPTALNYHIVPGTWLAEDLVDGMSLPTLQGQSLSVSIGENVTVDGAQVIQTDILAENGVIHVIDAGLAPAGYPQATVVTAIAQSEDHTAFETAIFNAYMSEYLSAQALEAEDDNNGDPLPGPYTVFAPTDDAVASYALANGYASAAAFLNSQNVDDFVERHVVLGVYASGDLSNGQVLEAISGDPVNIELTAEGAYASGAVIETADILAYNGVVHSLGAVLPLDIPSVEGTCGTWSINMYNISTSAGWGDNRVDIYIDGSLIASESSNELAIDNNGDGIYDQVGITTFEFAVNEGATVDVLFKSYSGASSTGYEVIDEAGNLIFTTAGNTVSAPGSVFGLKPCGPTPSCGFIEINLSDDSQEGWVGGALEVYSEEDGTYAYLDFTGVYFQSMYPFWQTRAYVGVNAGEIEFNVVTPQEYAESCGYVVMNAVGEVLVNQNVDFEAPQSVDGIVACEAGDDAQCNAEFDVDQATEFDGTPIPGAVNVTLYDFNVNATYAWDFGDEGTSNNPFPSHAYSTDGPYTLCLTVSDAAAGCSDTYCTSVSVDTLGMVNGFLSGFTITVLDGGESDVVNSVEEASMFSDINLYPNPATEFMVIGGISSNDRWEGRFVNTAGATVMEFNGNGTARIALDGMAPGIYTVQLRSGSFDTTTRRMVIK